MAAAIQTTVLVVEDDSSTREFVTRGLAKRGFGTMEAATVGEALLLIDQGTCPDTILLDLMLPDANGVVLLRRIRRENLPIRVAVVTGMAVPSDLFKMLGFAPDHIFKKPLHFPELIDWLHELE